MTTKTKIDLYKEKKKEYIAPATPQVVEIAEANYLAIEGTSKPGSEIFTDCVGALYAVAYTTKMTSKAAGQDYVVCKLEALWWSHASDKSLGWVPMDRWQWKLMIRVPDFITTEKVNESIKILQQRDKNANTSSVTLERFGEGTCIQMLHVGPYDREVETIVMMQSYAKENDFEFSAKHHEIYLSDPRRVEPAKLRTILRMPVKKKK